jgi:hypothetical protein
MLSYTTDVTIDSVMFFKIRINQSSRKRMLAMIKKTYQFPENEGKGRGEKYILDICRRNGINIKEMRAGTEIRSLVAHVLVADYGIPLAEIAREVGVSIAAV